jgi:hypothetical protein
LKKFSIFERLPITTSKKIAATIAIPINTWVVFTEGAVGMGFSNSRGIDVMRVEQATPNPIKKCPTIEYFL